MMIGFQGIAQRRNRGFSLLELIVVLIIVAFLVGIAINKMLILTAEAERSAYLQMIGTLRSALTLQVARQYATNKKIQASAYLDSNPMKLMAITPYNYMGSFPSVNTKEAKGGYWYFDEEAGDLIYFVRHKDYFSTKLTGRPRIIIKVVPLYYKKYENAKVRRKPPDRIYAFDIKAINTFTWRRPPK